MKLYDFYRDVLQLKESALIEEAVKATEIKMFKQGEYLIRIGETPMEMCFLMKGIVRGFMLDMNGKDMTDCIIFRCGNPVMPDNDFTQPASITLEALTDCEVLCIPISVVVHLLGKYPSLAELYQKLLLFSANLHRDLKIATYQYTAVQRYQWFLKEYPGLIDQISHKYIASLLNMTPVTLSKIRKIIRKGIEKTQ